MKRYWLLLLPILFLLILLYVGIGIIRQNNTEQEAVSTSQTTKEVDDQSQLANPASEKCVQDGGSLETVTQKDGSQFAMCNFGEYSCEEWVYYRGECDVEGDALKIYDELLKTGLDFSQMKVVIRRHLGEYIEGAVVPISAPAGGGYVFAVKRDSVMTVLAHGNGAILCESFKDFPDFSTYLVSQCIDRATGEIVVR